jgi:tRNA pseudouridine38-40 synthase
LSHKAAVKTLVLKIAYDGTDFVGMQRQPNGRTVEEVLTAAVERLYGERTTIVAAGRTDAGVHARCMVVHARLERADRIPLDRIQRAFNGVLPDDVRVVGVHLRQDCTFHARYDALRRTYSYTISRCDDPLLRRYTWHQRAPFREDVLQQCAGVFLGTHDFTTFSKLNPEQRSYICTVEQCTWHDLGGGRFRLVITANRFVYGMVRALVGAMLDCARGKRTLDEIADALRLCDRRHASPLAPPHGLVFESVEYPARLGVTFHSNCEER